MVQSLSTESSITDFMTFNPIRLNEIFEKGCLSINKNGVLSYRVKTEHLLFFQK